MDKGRFHIRNRISIVLISPLLRRLTATLVIICLIPSILIFCATFLIGIHVIQSNACDDACGILQQAQYNIHQTIDGIENIALSLEINDRFLTLLRDGSLQIGSADRVELRNILEDSVGMNRQCLMMLYVEMEDSDSSVYSSLFNNTPDNLTLYGSEYEEAILDASGALYWLDTSYQLSDRYDSALYKPTIRCVSAVYDFGEMACMGYLSLFVRTSAFQEDLSYLSSRSGSEIIVLLDRDSNMIASNRTIELDFYNGIVAVDDLSKASTLTLNGSAYLTTTLTDTKTNWTLICLQPIEELLQPMTSRAAFMLIPLLLIPVLSVFCAYLFSNQLNAQLVPLVSVLQKIQQGDLSVRAPHINDAMLDLIVNSLNETLDKYNEMVSKSSHQETLLAVNRLKVLRGQISPHFLYNTLDSVNWMLIEKGDLEMSQIISDLGDLLRYSINESSDTVPLLEEVDMVQRYLSICQNRFEDRMAYSITVRDGLEDYHIPCFLLQPLVENAVVHGIEKSSAGGHIWIDCYTTAENVTIDIADNGPSITPEVKEHLYRSFRDTSLLFKKAGSNHIGLANVNERIRLYAGERFGLQLLDIEPQGVVVRLTLPLNRPGGSEHLAN